MRLLWLPSKEKRRSAQSMRMLCELSSKSGAMMTSQPQRAQVCFQNGDQLGRISLPNFSLKGVDEIPRVTVMIANPRAGHYLVGEEKDGKFSRAGCVGLDEDHLERKLPVPRDWDIRKKVQEFIINTAGWSSVT